MSNDFKFLMIGAMYENGGNVTHRTLDGHPDLYVYPYESQVGTRMVNDNLASMFPVKYRWPVFALDASSHDDYKAIIDEECKVRTRTPHVSKFRHMDFDMDDDERCEIYKDYVGKSGRSRANNMEAFFRSTFDAWKNHNGSGRESVYVGYSPIIGIDADKIFADLPSAHFLHVVRNPWSAYADTKKRPVPMSLESYILGWNLNQYYALYFKNRYQGRFHIVRAEDVFSNPESALAPVLGALGLESNESLEQPSWNGMLLENVYPWGTIRKASEEQNKLTADELGKEEIDEIRARTFQYLELFGYSDFA